MDSTFFGQSTGLYFYSAVFQGNMALLAVVGAFTIFRTQYLENLIESENRACLDYVKSTFLTKHGVPYPLNIRALTVEGIELALIQLSNETTAEKAIRETARDILERELFYSFKRSQEGLGRVFDNFNASWRKPVRLVFALVMLSLALMLVATTTHICLGEIAEALVFLTVVVIQYLTIRSTIGLIKSMFLPVH